MIQLTKNILAVEVPNDATDVKLEMGYEGSIVLTWKSESSGYDLTIINRSWVSLIGVTPLLEEQWKEIVKTEVVGIYDEDDNIERYDYLYKNYYNPRDYNKLTATESGLSLLESKGLDINKKYAIIKIEK